jgi:hypothetical protein
MSYTEELLLKADEVIPRVTLEDFNNDSNSKVMIDVRQYEELQALAQCRDHFISLKVS